MKELNVSKNTPKRVEKTCQVCGNLFNATRIDARFCSNKCKQAAKRVKRTGGNVSSISDGVPENTGKHKEDVTVTDKAFVDDAASRGLVDWYRFSKEIFERKCYRCEKLFSTRLKLNHYCSPSCRDKDLSGMVK